MQNVLISVHTKSWTVARQWSPKDAPVGTVVVDNYAMISHNGQAPREYKVNPHEGCPNDGFTFVTMEEWSNDVHCTGCDYHKYYGIGD